MCRPHASEVRELDHLRLFQLSMSLFRSRTRKLIILFRKTSLEQAALQARTVRTIWLFERERNQSRARIMDISLLQMETSRRVVRPFDVASSPLPSIASVVYIFELGKQMEGYSERDRW